MDEELDPPGYVNPGIERAFDSIHNPSGVFSQLLRAQDSIAKYVNESYASQALLDLVRMAKPIIDLTAINAYKESLEFSAHLTMAASQISAQAALLNAAQSAAFANVVKTFNDWDAANRRLLDALPKFDFSMFQGLPNSYPPNWKSDFEPELLEEIIYKDGIPVVWVPDGRLLEQIVAAPDREARILILLGAADEVLEDCLRVVDESENLELLRIKPLAVNSINAWSEHPEAAQALAVVVADTLIQRWLPKITSAQNYKEMGESVKRSLAEVPIVKVREAFALAVIYSFYTKFNANNSATRPTVLSRHVTIHDANIDHFHKENSLIAIMVMSSLIRTFNDVI